jgi:hypothetical protein
MITITDSFGSCQIFTNTSGGPGFACSSDERLKEDWSDSSDALGYINSFRVRDFTMKSDGNRYTGILGQELMVDHPDMVVEGSDGTLEAFGPNQWKMVRAMQQLDAKVKGLEDEISHYRPTSAH